MTPIEEYNQFIGKKTVQAFIKRGIESYYCATKEEALEKALSLVPKDSKVAWGGSQTLGQIGLLDKLNNGTYNVLDRTSAQTPEERRAIELEAFDSDFYFLSSNAITKDGVMVNIDGYGNRVAALIFGPKNVVVIAGVNKITDTVEDAVKRVRQVAAPINTIRLKKQTPCATTGVCHNCTLQDSICKNVVITRLSNGDRIKVILVGESLGY